MGLAKLETMACVEITKVATKSILADSSQTLLQLHLHLVLCVIRKYCEAAEADIDADILHSTVLSLTENI